MLHLVQAKAANKIQTLGLGNKYSWHCNQAVWKSCFALQKKFDQTIKMLSGLRLFFQVTWENAHIRLCCSTYRSSWECRSDIQCWNIIHWMPGRGAQTKNIPWHPIVVYHPKHENTIVNTTTYNNNIQQQQYNNISE